MISKNQIKEIRSLQFKKYRQKYDKFIVEGHKSCIEFLRSEKFDITQIFIRDSEFEKYKHAHHNHLEKFTSITIQEMAKISMLKTPSDILMVCQKPEIPVNLQLNQFSKVIFLDRIQDPGNLGTIIRIADWFGIKLLVLSDGSADVYNPKVIQSSMGSICNVTCYYNNLDELVNSNLTEYQVIGTDMKGEQLEDFTWPEQFILILGNEGQGISETNETCIDKVVSIPGSESRIAESLNVANAMAILGYSIFSQ